MRSGIAKVKSVENVNVLFDKKLAHFKFDAKKVSLQELIKAVRGSEKTFGVTLLLHVTGDKAAISDAQAEMKKLKGVTKVSTPDKDGNIHIAFDLKAKTMLASIKDAAKKSGASLSDLKPKKSSR